MLISISAITGQILLFSFSKRQNQKQNRLKQSNKNWLHQKIKMITLSIFVLICTLLNTAPAVLVMVDWLGSYVCVFNVTYLLNIEMVDNITNRIPAIALRDVNNNLLNDVQVIDNMSQFENFTKLVILLFAVSSCLSFNMFILAFCCTYKCKWLRKWTQPRDVKVSQLNAEPLEAFYVTKKELYTRKNEY